MVPPLYMRTVLKYAGTSTVMLLVYYIILQPLCDGDKLSSNFKFWYVIRADICYSINSRPLKNGVSLVFRFSLYGYVHAPTQSYSPHFWMWPNSNIRPSDRLLAGTFVRGVVNNASH